MTKQERMIGRQSIALIDLLKHPVESEFANDSSSVFIWACPALSEADVQWACIQSAIWQMDILHFSFLTGDEDLGVEGISIFMERDGGLQKLTECLPWAPADGGPLLIVHEQSRLVNSYDGLALTGKTLDLGADFHPGVARARTRLREAAAAVTDEKLARLRGTAMPLAA